MGSLLKRSLFLALLAALGHSALALSWQEGWELVAKAQTGDAQAARALIEAYNQGDAEAGTAIGVLYLNGITYPRDLAKARSYLEWARGKGSGWGSAMLGLLYANGWGVGEDPRQARALFEEAAQRSYPGGRAFRALLALADQSNKPSLEATAALVRDIQEAATTGEPMSLSALARLYLGGYEKNGIPQDWGKARALWEEAVAKGYLLGGQFLTIFYHFGYGGPPDQVRAVALAERLADLMVAAKSILALAYYSGNGGKPLDQKRACQLAQESRSHPHGAAVYGLCLLEGHLPGGRAQGYAWLLKAAAGGNDLAKSLAPEWEKRLSRQEVDEAKRLLPNLR